MIINIYNISAAMSTMPGGAKSIFLTTRYNAEGPETLGDLRRRNGAPATILSQNCWREGSRVQKNLADDL